MMSGSFRLFQEAEQKDGISNSFGMKDLSVTNALYNEVGSRPILMLIGGGHRNLAIAESASLLKYEIVLVEENLDISLPAFFPMVDRIYCGRNLLEALKKAEIDRNTRIVIDSEIGDIDVLQYIIGSKAYFIGMLASKRKVGAAVIELRNYGVDEVRLSRLFSLLGITDGAGRSPAETAVCVLAEILNIETRIRGAEHQYLPEELVVVRGAGDLATGVACRLFKAGFSVVCLEISQPKVIRRTVAFAEAMYAGSVEVEGIGASCAMELNDVYRILQEGLVPVLCDSEAKSVSLLKPAVLLDAILAKKNLGTNRDMAPVTLALGPGFEAGKDVDAVIETARGHDLGRVILSGHAAPDTGIPGNIKGESLRRVLRAPASGLFTARTCIGDIVSKGDLIASVGGCEILSPFDGKIRGLLADGLNVSKGFKVGDVDPRGVDVDAYTISDKARALGGAVLEAILMLRK